VLSDLELLRSRRDHEPIWFDAKSGAWHIYRYDDVSTVLSDPHSFSSDFASVYPDRADLMIGNIVAMDPPRHTHLRELVTRAFSPKVIAQLEPRIRELTTRLLDRLGSRRRFELVSNLAYPLPVSVIAELLGVPPSDRRQFKAWADALLDQERDPGDTAAVEQARSQIRNFHDYLGRHVARRRARPRQDLLSDLVLAEVDGARLEDDEIIGFATLLLLAGHITTTLLLGNLLLCLDEHPRLQPLLRRSPELVPSAIEEALRYRSPVPFTARVTTREVTLGNVSLPPQQQVFVSLISANHDERRFPDPEAFVVDRHPNPHLAFGRGIHFCLGAPLARLEARIVLGLLLEHYGCLRVDRDHPPRPYARFNGVRSLHLVVHSS
jgi:cytochrome P450